MGWGGGWLRMDSWTQNKASNGSDRSGGGGFQ